MAVIRDVESWARDMQEFRESQGFRTYGYKARLRSLCAYCRKRTSQELDKDTVLGWLEECAETGSADATYRKASVVRSLANYINAFGGRAYVLPHALQPSRKSSFVPHVPDDAEMSRLFAAIDGVRDSGPGHLAVRGAYAVLFRLIYTCGLRPGEGVRAKTADLDLAAGTLFVRETKFHKERFVALSEPMSELLRKYVRELGRVMPKSESLFPAINGRHVNIKRVEKRLSRCWMQAHGDLPAEAVPRIRVYDLRHRFASAVLQKWLDEGRNIYSAIPLLRAYMGHSSLTSTLYYVHLLPENLRLSKGVDWERLNSLVPEVAT